MNIGNVAMNVDYLGLKSTMIFKPRTPLRRPPPPPPSKSLVGMEKVIPPDTPSKRSLSSLAPTDKPLPQRPRSSSSVYSGDSGYTKIIELYENWAIEEEPPTATETESKKYRETLSPLLTRRFGSVSSAISPLSVSKFVKQPVSIPSLRVKPDKSTNSNATDPKNAPSFVEFARDLRTARSDIISPLPSLASPHYAAASHDTFWQPELKASPEFRAIIFDHEREHLAGQVSPRIADVVDSHLMPPPLDLNRSSQIYEEQQSNRLSAQGSSYITASKHRSSSRFSNTPSSSDSFVVYTGVRESIRAMIRTRLGNKKDTRPYSEEREIPEAVFPMGHPLASSKPYQVERKFSGASSRRSSLQQGVSNLLRTLSRTKASSPTKQPPQKPLARQKQLAIPLSSYQKYGPAVWHNSQRKKRQQARAARAPQIISPAQPVGIKWRQTQSSGRAPPQRQNEVFTAFQSGRNQIIHALGETKHKITRTNSEKRRGALRNKISHVRDGEQTGRGGKITRTTSEKRRDKLKKSISIIGPMDPSDIVPDVRRTDSEERKEVLKNRITEEGPVDQYQQLDTEVNYWL